MDLKSFKSSKHHHSKICSFIWVWKNYVASLGSWKGRFVGRGLSSVWDPVNPSPSLAYGVNRIACVAQNMLRSGKQKRRESLGNCFLEATSSPENYYICKWSAKRDFVILNFQSKDRTHLTQEWLLFKAKQREVLVLIALGLEPHWWHWSAVGGTLFCPVLCPRYTMALSQCFSHMWLCQVGI